MRNAEFGLGHVGQKTHSVERRAHNAEQDIDYLSFTSIFDSYLLFFSELRTDHSELYPDIA